MPIYRDFHSSFAEVDVIVAGGGTAGCTVAGRLAETDPNLSVLLIEGGTNNRDVHNVIHPALFPDHVLPNSKTAIFYQTIKQPQLVDREPIVPAGGILGGGSSINLMLYTRAQRSDFESWKTKGWSADELMPFLKKLETYHGAVDAKHHGFSGPVHISDGGFRVEKSENDFLQAAEKVGYPEIKDLQDLDSNNGFGRWMRTVTPDGKRCDSAHAYVHPLLEDGKHPNFHVMVETQITRVIFDSNKKACGVEVTPNKDYVIENGRAVGSKQTIRAKKMVVLSCGACASPLVLERSGIGSPEILKRAGVDIVADVPGVGNDYQDHNLIFFPYRTDLEPHETTDALLSGRLNRDDAIADKNKIMSWNTCDISGKVRPTEREVEALGPEFQSRWEADFKNNPNRPIMLMSLVSSYLGDQTTIKPGQYVSIATFTAYPYSRGHVHITGSEVTDPLDFSLGFFTDRGDVDLKKQIWAYKKHREIMRRTKMYKGEVASGHPQFNPTSAAACIDLSNPGINGDVNGSVNGHTNGTGDIKDIQYTPEDDAAIEKFLRENINTTWHSLGTVKMAPRDEKGGVDGNLNVYGVSGLKVIDLSICPENVAANTNNTAFVVGEKGANIVLSELGYI